MKKKILLAGVLALSLAFGGALAGCDDDDDRELHNQGSQSGTTQQGGGSQQGGTEQSGAEQGGTQQGGGSQQGGSQQGGSQEGEKVPSDEVVGTFSGLTDTESVYAVGAVTTAKLLSFSLAGEAASLADTIAEGDNSGFDLKDTIENLTSVQAGAADFNKYFNMLDSFLNKQALTTVVIQNNAEGELAQNDYKAVITGKNAANENVEHTLYYSETLIRKVEDNNRGESFTEENYYLEGVVVMPEGAYYYMSGTHTLRSETEDGETEKSETLDIRASATPDDAQNYVLLHHENESEEEWGEVEEESEYVYTIYSGGRRVEQTAVEFETGNEHGQTETEYEIKLQSGGSSSSYEVERVNVNGKTYIEVEYNIDGTCGKFVILKNEDGTYQYKFTSRASDDRTFRDYDD